LEISFKKSSVRGSIPKEISVRGSILGWKDTFSIDDKGGEIYHDEENIGMIPGERWSQGEHE
jgi:hypothetical protein